MELRKCECGGDASVEYVVNRDSFECFCDDCFCVTVGFFYNQEQAIQAWNEGKVE